MQSDIAPDVQENLRTLDEAARVLRVSRRTMYRLVEAGEISAYRFSRHQGLRFSASDISEYLEKHRVAARD
jgi:excisionase family DNA binding protein